ncbi:MAG TPA: spore coat protein u [Rhizobiales bacterium]|nr:spore coat protein u [Hyphomicrobiales bacterium]
MPVKPLLTSILSGLCAVVALLVITPGPALALTCNATIPDVDFGTVDLSSGSPVNTSVRMTVTCTGIPRRRVKVCINIGSGSGSNAPSGDPRYMLNGANRLNYNLYKNAALTRVWGSWVWPYPPTGVRRRLRIRNNGTGRRRIRMRAQIHAGQSGAQAGLYISSFASFHTLVTASYNTSQSCRTISSSTAGTQAPFVVRANVLGACTITTSDMNFGTAGLLSANVDARNRIRVRCTPGLAYTIGLDNGSSGGTGPASRLMASGGQTVTYGIYQNNARTVVWGNTPGVNTVAAVGTGGNQNYRAYGRVPPQPTPPPGTYTDTVTVVVTY